MVYKFFDKKSKGRGVNREIKQNEQLADELHKPITKKFKRRKVYFSFKVNNWSTDLADMQLIIKFNEVITFLLCAIATFSKYPWIVTLKYKMV